VPNRPALMSDRRACSSRDRWLKPGERGRFYLSDQLPGSRLDGGSHRSPYLHSEVVPTTQDAERPRAWRNQKCRTLITNDDGLSSGGVRALAAAAVGAGLEVTVVVPNWDSSGSGASLTAVSERGQVLVERNEDGWPAGISALGVHGPPALIVRAAVFGAFGPPPHVVLSGVNRGVNTGRAVIHSGTVGAALTAAAHGRRALAISAQVGPDPRWETAADVAHQAIGWLMRAPAATVLNVNVPDCPSGRPRGVKAARLATFGVVQANVTEVDKGFVPVTFADVGEIPEPGTDSAALQDGYVSVSAVRSVCDDERFALHDIMG